jgi:archaemetzincin
MEQYSSPLFLVAIRDYAEENGFDKILGITTVDLFVGDLYSIFGQAEFGSEGRAAVISLSCLYPEFYGQESNRELFLMRTVKEGIHEIGHTFGLKHCRNSCIMVHSSSVFDIDNKPTVFCDVCQKKIFQKG